MIFVCAGLDMLCLCAAGFCVDSKGLALLALTDYFVCRVFHLFHVRKESHRSLKVRQSERG